STNSPVPTATLTPAATGTPNGTTPTPTSTPLAYCLYRAADFNGDGVVNSSDLSIFAHWYGKTVPPAPQNVDLNGDGVVNSSDLTLFAHAWQHHVTECA